MNDLASPWLIAGAAACILAAAILRGLTGFGFAIAAVPLLSLFMPPLRAVPIVICLQGAAGLFDLRSAWRESHGPSLRWLVLGTLLATPLGVVALNAIPDAAARLAVAFIAVLAIVVVASGRSLPASPGRITMVAVGLLSGLCNGLAAMPGPAVVAFYMAMPLSRSIVRASCLIFFVATAATGALSAAWLGLIDRQTILTAGLALPVMLAGTWLGHRLFRRGSERLHRLATYACLAGAALAAGLKGIAGLV